MTIFCLLLELCVHYLWPFSIFFLLVFLSFELHPTFWPLATSVCHFWANDHTHLRKADLTVLKATKIAEQEENMGHYFGSVMSSVNQNLNFKCCLQPCLGLWYFDWLASAWWSRIIHSSQNSFSPLKSSWLKSNMSLSWVGAVINWPKCGSDGFLGEECSLVLFFLWSLERWLSVQTWLPSLISSFAKQVLDYQELSQPTTKNTEYFRV